MRRTLSSRAPGATLVELIVVMAITAIVSAIVAVFIQRPVEGYVDATRRAELTDIADTALRRISRDLRTALPNSVRVSGTYIEFMQTSGGGRYRSEPTSGGGGDPLSFTTADTSFDVIGPVPTLTGSESIVIYNLNSASTATTANAYAGDNRATSATAGVSPNITFTAPPPGSFPFVSPGKRFHVVQYPVTYGCDLGTGRLTRYWGYTPDINQPVPPVGAQTAILATRVTDCSFRYVTGAATARGGVVALILQIEQNNEKVRLFQQAHVTNVP